MRAVCFLLLVLPIAIVFDPGPEESKGEWVNRYIMNTFAYALFYIPLITTILIIPIVKNRLKILLIVFSLILSIIGSYSAFQLIIAPIQDFIPKMGLSITVFIFPIIIVNSMIEWGK